MSKTQRCGGSMWYPCRFFWGLLLALQPRGSCIYGAQCSERPQQRARCCCLTEVSSSHSIPKLLGSQIHSHSYAVVQDRGRKREQLEWNMPASAKDPLHFIVNIWEVRGRRKGQVKNWTKTLVLFSGQLMALIVLTSVSSFHMGAGYWIVTCFAAGWRQRRRGCLAPQGWMGFQSTRLKEAVAQFQKAQLLQSEEGSVAAALWYLSGRQTHKPCTC